MVNCRVDASHGDSDLGSLDPSNRPDIPSSCPARIRSMDSSRSPKLRPIPLPRRDRPWLKHGRKSAQRVRRSSRNLRPECHRFRDPSRRVDTAGESQGRSGCCIAFQTKRQSRQRRSLLAPSLIAPSEVSRRRHQPGKPRHGRDLRPTLLRLAFFGLVPRPILSAISPFASKKSDVVSITTLTSALVVPRNLFFSNSLRY